MSSHPVKRLLIISSMLLCWTSAAPAQAPSPEAMTAASNLVTTLQLSDRYKALLPAILLSIKPTLTQDRPEIERDYDTMTATVADAYTPYYNAMIESAAMLYASSFSVEELREIEAFYRRNSWISRRPSCSRPFRSATTAAARPPKISRPVLPSSCARSCKKTDDAAAAVIANAAGPFDHPTDRMPKASSPPAASPPEGP